ncbi:AAA family ATPase [Paenibacillus sabinae]|uniref:CO dehydrogenase/acetyl-CoA synthase complex, accessory protein CooC n=1 Tax=Paenibacillus sabinae T27 TaxID=1268072 RepID=X4ZZ05_9BACL|nr:AAA family ATPase [Paenibacillus sabinae]AHV97403.1 CO dehydrogenase/acetyl-CoA synthase complex, accessory protein CooC [Paenibacillus sabinae T27]
MSQTLKIAISGKGGVGKTTVAAMFAQLLTEKGHRVLAIDADQDANLGMALGFGREELSEVRTIADDRDLIKKKTGGEPGVSGSWFSLNPKVDDIPAEYVVSKGGIRLLQMGGASKGGAGCACPQSTLLKTLLNYLVTEENDAVIIDFEAGLEHLGRSTAKNVDALILVIEPGRRSLETAKSVIQLAKDIGIEQFYLIQNKWMEGLSSTDVAFFADERVSLLGSIPFNPVFVSADREGTAVSSALDDGLIAIFEQMLNQLLEEMSGTREYA